ncbi:Uncharacterised protein [Chryseobacterium carnipullorum]|uniref:Uncharacterized protein n=1 Tax=Chryseobacterium carnipullorum TaxID=1124835 RepID=A0A376DPJ3_CHRCU|nr:Uncharacterised protein [Chryseobacterium carnipullorum]
MRDVMTHVPVKERLMVMIHILLNIAKNIRVPRRANR